MKKIIDTYGHQEEMVDTGIPAEAINEIISVLEKAEGAKPTNFSRITASFEALAEFLWDYTHDVLMDYENISDPMFRYMSLKNVLKDNCTKKEAWLEWLKQECDT